ncbi:MAG TPA: hypothetical protein VFE17_05290 [Candidatus Baltobacteraceae bacterium]|jgi:hypothetical protein|nr:hypothetical protein [Candidatus Baltobacteraceae bacterium]
MNDRDTAQNQTDTRRTVQDTTGNDTMQGRDVRDMPDTGDMRDTRDMRSGTDTRNMQTRSDPGTMTDDETGFLPDDRMSSLRERWNDVQAGFVDDPRTAVQNAQTLVTEIVTELTETFTRERTNLESQWSGGGDADTEALRIALQRYRSFFNRLLST